MDETTLETTVSTIPQFLTALTGYPNLCCMYRGQSDADRPLVPKAGRPEYFLPDFEDPDVADLPPRDLCRFNHWRDLAVAYNKARNRSRPDQPKRVSPGFLAVQHVNRG